MPRYIEVISATTETATKILALRAGGKGKREIRVTTYGGRTASVEWNDDRSKVTLNMPTLPADAVLTRAEADRLVAFIGHECCHVLHSDRDVWAEACLAGERVRDWVNALEDVRIEAKEIRAGHFPALGSLLAGMLNHLHYETVTGKGGKTVGKEVRNAPYVTCVLGRVANGYTVPAAAGLAKSQSPEVARLTGFALAGLPGCRSTADVLTLARQLVALENDSKPGRKGQDPGQEGREGQDQGQEGREGQDQGQEGREGQGDETQGQESAGDETQGQEGQGDETQGQEGQGDETQGQEGQEGQGQESAGDETQGQEGRGAGIATDANLIATIEKIAERAGIDLDNSGNALAADLSTTRMAIKIERQLPAEYNTQAAAVLNTALPKNAILGSQIGRLLVSAEIRRSTHHESSGRLDRRALVRMRTGAADIYSRRDDVAGIDTALMILIDGSSSMAQRVGIIPTSRNSVSRMAIAQTSAWHIACAAEAANAKVAIGVFYSGYDASPQQLVIVKPWAITVADCAGALADTRPNGGTPLSPAIIACADMLAEMSATRHILMVLTDGECNCGPEGVTSACRLAADRGVETVGIGMDCAAVTKAFPPRYSVNVKNLTQLATTGLGVLVTMLEDANPRGAD